MATRDLQPQLPAYVGGVKILGRIGHGAMGEVFHGLDEALQRNVAVKLLKAVEDPEARVRFDREAAALARLTHPNVVCVYQKGMHEGCAYFVMELVDGPNVGQVLEQQGPFAVPEALEIVRQAALGLRAAAQAGVTHRDIKPANLLMAKDGTVKVADFGVCKVMDGPPGATLEGTTLGTPFYMAPEQARGGAVDPRADQYALGATLYHLLSGKTPYPAQHTLAQLYAHQEEPVPNVTHALPGVAPGVAALVGRLMAKKAEDRFAHYDDLLTALDALVTPSESPPSRTWLWPAVGAAAVALMAGAWAGWPWVLPLNDPKAAAPEPVPPHKTLPPPPPPEPSTEWVTDQDAGPSRDLDIPVSTPPQKALAGLGAAAGPDRAAAMRVLSRQRDTGARAALEKIVVDPRDDDAPLAALLLGEMGDQEATPALVKALDAPRRSTVLAAVDALSRLHDVRAVEPLRAAATHHEDATVRHRAARAAKLLFGVE